MSASQLGVVGTLASTPQLVWLESSSEAFTPTIYVIRVGRASPPVSVLLVGLFVLLMYCAYSEHKCPVNMTYYELYHIRCTKAKKDSN